MNLNNKFVRIAGTVSVGGVMFAGVAALDVQNNGEGVAQAAEAESAATQSKDIVCADSVAMNDSDVLASEYATVATADCMFVGCGGMF